MEAFVLLDQIILFKIFFVILFLIFSSLIDLKYSETPNFTNFGLLFLGFFYSILISIYNHSFLPFLYSILGAIFMGFVGFLFFYSSWWGGGDLKLILALGSFFGLPITGKFSLSSFFHICNELLFKNNLNVSLKELIQSTPILFLFLFLLVFGSAIYSILWLKFKIIFERKRFFSYLKKQHKKHRFLFFLDFLFLFVYLLSFSLIFFVLVFYWNSWENLFNLSSLNTFFTIFNLSFIFFFISLIYILLRIGFILEKHLLVKKVSPEDLVEGDWIYSDIKIEKKIVVKKRNTGLLKEDILKLLKLKQQGKLKYIKIKQGIPFFPAFLFSFLILVLLLLI